MKALQYMATGAFLDASEAFSTFQASPRSTSALNTAALGNSAEQRDVLDEAFLVCLLSSGRLGEASTLIWNRVEVCRIMFHTEIVVVILSGVFVASPRDPC